MKAIVLLILVATAFAAKTTTQDQILALLQTGTKSADAIDSVFELLNDLKESNEEAQYVQDEQNKTNEFIADATLSRFQQILSLNQKLFAEATSNRAYFEAELKQTKAYLAFNEARREEITRKTESLQEVQCYSNQLFVRSLKLNQEALEAISFLKNDLSSYVAAGTENLDFAQVSKTQVKSVADKLKQYSSIFNANEIHAFLQLAESSESSDSDSESSDDSSDSTSEDGAPAKRRGTLPQQLLQVLEDLEKSVGESIENLKANEINAAWQLAGFIQSSEAEYRLLEQETVRKALYADRAATQIQAALAQQAKVSAILQESQDALDQAISDIENKRDAYQVEKSKRDEENAILDEVTTMFKNQVSSWSGRF